MQAIEFQTTVEKIAAAMPKDKREELRGYRADDFVRVLVLAAAPLPPQAAVNRLQDAADKGYSDFFEYLMDHPPAVDAPRRFTREELHEH